MIAWAGAERLRAGLAGDDAMRLRAALALAARRGRAAVIGSGRRGAKA